MRGDPSYVLYAKRVHGVAPGYSGAAGRFPAICGMPALPIE